MSRWKEADRTFTPPEHNLERFSMNAPPEEFQKLVYGFTTIELHHRSGKIKFITTPGDQT